MMDQALREGGFGLFVRFFPELPLPVVLAEENVHAFQRDNDPLPEDLARQYLHPLEPSEPDEFTEFLPCFRLAGTGEFHALVYWKGALLNYHFVLATFTRKGVLIDRRVLSGTSMVSGALLQSLALVDEDWRIRILSGMSSPNDDFEAKSSTMLLLELQPEGRIVEIADEPISGD